MGLHTIILKILNAYQEISTIFCTNMKILELIIPVVSDVKLFLNFNHNILFSGFPSAPELATNEIKHVSSFILAIITYYNILSY